MPGAFFSKRHFLFDLDGTLVDSSAAHARAYAAALQKGHPMLAAKFDYAPFAGQPTRQVFVALGFAEEAELVELTRRKQGAYRDALERGEVDVFPGAEAVLAQLREFDRSLFVVTGASQEATEMVLKQTGLGGYFLGSITAKESPKGKPGPEPYLAALSTFGLRAGECVAIEDGENGVRSAQAAGLDVALIHSNLNLSGVAHACDWEELGTLLLP
jgi:HAD superfamily hydrolase (TIGR01509 family)